ncbi:MAG TPA: hypothetical protein VG015_04035, partial [Candidatus Dormibacteraeota bacterium]|nr:hypothetical protein [Candidatus Dormibacteraeota bacterium]
LIAAIMMAAAMAIIGAGVWLDRPRNLFLILGSILAMSFWVTTEFLGGILTGQGTDPNTGPLIVLLGVCVGMRRERWFPGAPDPPRSPRTAGVE